MIQNKVKIIVIIGKLRLYIGRGYTIELDTLADEIAEQSGFERGIHEDMRTNSRRRSSTASS